ncbi:MAG: ribosomal protection-like ABC-F family protein [Patescibacteria group bacterium]
MISFKNINKSFNGQIVLRDINFSISEHESLALVGRNGSGKSTLLKIMAGILGPDEGSVDMLSDLKVAYFPQEIPQKDQKKTAKELIASAMGSEPEKVYGKIADLLGKLKLSKEKLDCRVETLSGGEKSKVMLALILKSSADIFLLDEPTNNLDLQGLVILENFIMSSSAGFLIVSHDRKFLERIVVGIIEMNEETYNVEIYSPCTYSKYLKERKRKEEQELAAYQDYIDEKRKFETAIRERKQEAQRIQKGPKVKRDHDKYIVSFKKDRSKKIASQASSLEKRLERLESVQKPKFHLPLNLEFRFLERSGDIVFRLESAEAKQDNFHLGPINIEIDYGNRIAILGPNGGGKSTFLQILIGMRQPDSGFIHHGSRVKIGYLPQENIFEQKHSVLKHFLEQADISETNARRILNRFGFSADDVKRTVEQLSPGERSRLILATLMAKETNCLILDEPSNHLDPEALDRLETVLKDFPGTIIMVSHDRYLIDQTGITKTYLMENGKLIPLKDYHDYENLVLPEK